MEQKGKKGKKPPAPVFLFLFMAASRAVHVGRPPESIQIAKSDSA